MADRQKSEERVDLDGDMMDEEDAEEDPVEEEAYRNGEDDDERGYGDDSEDGGDDEEDDGRRRRLEKLPVEADEDGAGGGSGVLQEGQGEEKKVEAKEIDEEDAKKRAELLAMPPHGSEVFIGGLPRDANEEELRELCEPFGEIYELRLMKDKETRESKGYAFIMFTSSEAAQLAIEGIHEKELKGRTLRCSLSQAKHRLFVGNIPKSLSEEELRKILEKSSPGVEHVEMFKDPQNPARNRGFLFVEYYNHACADYARQKMSSPNFAMDGSNPTVTWADPKNSSDSSGAAQVKAIYVKNLPENVTSERLKELFEGHGEITKVVLPPAKAGQGKRDFGFIHFAERSSALKVVKATEKYEIDGHVLEVSFAKPQSDKKIDHATKPGLAPNFPPHPSYGYPGDPYGAYGGVYGGHNQPIIYGRGQMPAGMRMVPMVLPDGRIGYVLQQPPPPPPRRSDRGSASSEGGGRNDGNRGRRFRPY